MQNLKFRVSSLLSIFAFLVFIFGLQEPLLGKNVLYENLIFNPFHRFLGKRMMSFHYHPSVLATYFLSVLPFSIFLAKFQRNQKDLIVALLGVCSCLLGTLLTFTRTAFLILFICFSFYFFIIKKKYLIYIFLSSIVLISVATVSMSKNTSFSRFSPLNPYIRYRLEKIPIAAEIWMPQPFTGVGFGNFRHLFNVFGNKRTPYEFKIPDNMYLSLLSETGILGSGSFFTIFVYFITFYF